MLNYGADASSDSGPSDESRFSTRQPYNGKRRRFKPIQAFGARAECWIEHSGQAICAGKFTPRLALGREQIVAKAL